MNRAYLPFLFLPSRPLIEAVGEDLRKIAILAVRAVMRHRKGLEVAHQQITYGRHHIALSTRITGAGELVVEMDLGDPRLADRLILEDDIRRAGRSQKDRRGVVKRRN